MRLPPSLRYLPSRLQVAFNPWLWLGILLTGIVGIYAWEYRQNPAQLWQISATSPNGSEDPTSTDVLLESLTPDEQAIAAELDNVELLLAQLDSDVSALTTGGEESAAAALNAYSINASGEISESGVERLNRYIDEYNFLGTNAKGANVQPERSEAPTPGEASSESVLTLQPTSQTDRTASALAEALARQQIEQEAAANSSPEPSSTPSGEAAETATAETASTEGTSDSQAFSFDQPGVTPGRLEGLNRAFIRTTPNMSPPPGTTGYVPPTSLPDFTRANQAAGVNPFGAQPSGLGRSTVPSSVDLPDRSQVLPPADSTVVTPLPIPTVDGSSQVEPDRPRNAWEAFFD
ncbi:MAG: hypothetical protein AAGA46_14060 [Cyanobacteria bacterium P01_F01_bin.13]